MIQTRTRWRIVAAASMLLSGTAACLGAPPEEDPQIKAAMNQARPQFEALLDGRLHAIRDLCQPTPTQERALLEHGKRGMEEALRKYATHSIKHNNGAFVVGFNGQQRRGATPEIDMDEMLAAAVAEHLDAPQQAKHLQEQEERTANRRRVCAEAIVAALDVDLLLTEEQRQQLSDKLSANWDRRWDGCEKSMQYGPQFLPKIPDKLVRPLLDADQKRLWSKQNRHGSSIHLGELSLIGGNPDCRIAPFRVEPEQDRPVNEEEAAP